MLFGKPCFHKYLLEDCYGLEVCESEDLRVNPVKGGSDGIELQEMLDAWNTEMTKLKNKEITQEEYDRWRYHYPKDDTSGKFRKVGPSQKLSAYLVKAFADRLKD